jgi:hypothetical protein
MNDDIGESAARSEAHSLDNLMRLRQTQLEDCRFLPLGQTADQHPNGCPRNQPRY